MGIVAPMPVTVYAKYEFSEDEKRQLGSELAGKIDRAEGLKTEKKSLVSELNERIDNAASEIKRISSNINLGFETRSYTCKVEKNFKLKIKEYYCVHTGKLIDTKKFEPHDFQQTFEDVKDAESGTRMDRNPKSGMDIDPTLSQGVDLNKRLSKKQLANAIHQRDDLKKKAIEKEGTKILNKAGLKKNAQPKKDIK